MSARGTRNLLAGVLVTLVAVVIFEERVSAGCPNPRLSYTVTVTGPEEDCEEAVEEHTGNDCPGLCQTCGRTYDDDYDTENNVCILGEDFKSRSGWIQCNCKEPI